MKRRTKKSLLLSKFIRREFKDGLVSAAELLEMARPKGSPIHSYFDWDDGPAAEKWRLHQARQWIATLVITENNFELREYVTPVITADEESHHHYIRLDVAKRNTEIWQLVLDRALEEAQRWMEKYEHLKQLSQITRAIKKVIVERSKDEKRSSSKA